MESGFGAGQAFGQVAQNNYTKQLNNQAAYVRPSVCRWLPMRPVGRWAAISTPGPFNLVQIQGSPCHHYQRRGGRHLPPIGRLHERLGRLHVLAGTRHGRCPVVSLDGLAGGPGDAAARRGHERDPAARPAASQCRAGGALGLRREPLSTFDHRGQWKSWLALAPSSGVWTFTVRAQGAGVWELEVDGVPVARGSGAAAAPAAVRLVHGQHGIRLRNRGGSFKLEAIEVAAGE